MQFLYFLEGIRNPVCDFLFSLITHIGEETLFLAIAIFFFWCIDKREGYYILITGLMGTVINQFLKITFRIERPFDRDTSFTIVESARAEATGYSFPSGHTQNAAGTFGAIGMWSRKWGVRIFTAVIIVLVAFSRMYLGVHTPLDVGVSLIIAAALLLVLYPFFKNEDRFHKAMPVIIGICALISLAFLIYAVTLSPEGIKEENYNGVRDNAATLFGCLVGLCVVYPLDRFVIRFRTDAKWYANAIKLILGLALVLLVKEGLRYPLEAIVGLFTDTPRLMARGIRYFLVVIVAGVLWPLSFNFFSRLSIPFMDRFTLWLKGKFAKN